MQTEIIKEAIQHLTQRGFTIHSITCDGTATNMSTGKQLGCNFKQEHFQTYFPHPYTEGEFIYFIFDPCHLLKNLRNYLGQYTKIFDEEGGQISWKYIIALHEFQLKDNLNLATKLAGKHIHYHNNKMKVKLAAQTFSSSVAQAINFLRDEKCLPQFQKSQSTTNFINIIDELFDVCNSSNPIGKYRKAPICESNLESKIEFLQMASSYLKNLKGADGVNMYKANKKQGFLGFMITISSLIGLARRLLIQLNQRYFLTYKISQDHLETFFSQIRNSNGFNNNPNCLSFRYALRKNMLKNGIKPSAKANCIDQSEQYQDKMAQKLHAKKSKNPTNLQALVDVISNPSIVHDDINFYLAGFIGRKLRKTIKCNSCSFDLVKKASELNNHQNAAFTNIRNRGGLLASEGINSIVQTADVCLRNLIATRKISSLSAASVIRRQVFDCEKHTHLLDTMCCRKQIIFLVCKLYTKIMMHHHAQLITERCIRKNQGSMRHKFTKAVHFLHH